MAMLYVACWSSSTYVYAVCSIATVNYQSVNLPNKATDDCLRSQSVFISTQLWSAVIFSLSSSIPPFVLFTSGEKQCSSAAGIFTKCHTDMKGGMTDSKALISMSLMAQLHWWCTTSSTTSKTPNVPDSKQIIPTDGVTYMTQTASACYL